MEGILTNFSQLLKAHSELLTPTMKVKDFKKLVEYKTGTCISNQRYQISFNLTESTNDEECLWQYISIRVFDISKFPIRISGDVYGKKIILDANKTIAELKQKVCEETKIPKERLIFHKNQNILNDNIILKNEDICNYENHFFITISEIENKSLLKVKYPDNTVKEVSIDLTKTGFELMELIENKKLKNENDIKYKMKYNNQIINLSNILIYYEIKSGDFIELEKRETMIVFIKSFTGKTIEINVSPDESIGSLKYYTRLTIGTPQEYMRFIFNGISLDDNKTLNEYKIVNNSILHMVLTIRG